MNITTYDLSRSCRRCQQGFTLVELMVTMSILAIIVSIAAPNISTQMANMRIKSTTATLENALQKAKIESVIRRQPVSVKYTASSGSNSITVADTNKKIITSYSYDEDSIISVESSEKVITFYPSKRVDAAITYVVCDDSEKVKPRQITVSASTIIKSSIGGKCS